MPHTRRDSSRPPYYLYDDYRDIEVAQTFEELLPIALDVIRRMPQPVAMVCGPISSGGFGSVQANLEHFNNRITELILAGVTVFSQMPFEDKIQEIKANKITIAVAIIFWRLFMSRFLPLAT